MVRCNSISYFFEQHGLTCFRLGNNESALAFTDRRKQIDDTYTERVSVITFAQREFLVREEWGKVLECDTFLYLFRVKSIDTNHFVHREVLIAISICAKRTFNGVTGFEAVLSYLLLADIDVVG